MPTATRRQAHVRPRNRGIDEPAVDITSDELPPQSVDVDMDPGQNVEDDGLDGPEEEDEGAGTTLMGFSSSSDQLTTRPSR